MKPRTYSCGILIAASLAFPGVLSAQTTAFTYQGRLNVSGDPANGVYDFTFQAFDASTGGYTVGVLMLLTGVGVTNGLFSAPVDLGPGVFTGPDRWLQITVSTNGANNFTTLTPREPITPVPYAIYANTAGTVTNGAIGSAQLAANAVGASQIAAGQVVKSLNGLQDNVTLSSGANVTLATNGSNLTISSTGGGAVFALNGTSAYYNAGNVGIGTTTPGYPLDVEADSLSADMIRWRSTYQLGLLGQSSGAGFLGLSTSSDRTVELRANGVSVLNGGNVGIGTSTPQAPLHVVNANGNYGQLGTANYGVLASAASGTGVYGTSSDPSGYGLFASTTAGWALGAQAVTGPFPNLWPTAYLAGGSGVGGWAAQFLGNQDLHGYLQLTGQGKFIDFYSPANYDFRIIGEGDFANRTFTIFDDTTGTRQDRLTIDSLGRVGIGTTSPQTALHVQGETTTCVLTISGGCDVSEPFQFSSQEAPKGAVVAIDRANPGQLKLSDHSYDKRVAGIVSGANGVNPGISLHQLGRFDGGQNVALSGRVYALADASQGEIEPGDLLTTSETPGHCMKATDPAKSQGAIIGKAMSSLKEGKGMVLVLVSLQ